MFIHMLFEDIFLCSFILKTGTSSLTRYAMYVERNIVPQSRNHCCSGNNSVYVVELHVTVSYMKILSVAQQ